MKTREESQLCPENTVFWKRKINKAYELYGGSHWTSTKWVESGVTDSDTEGLTSHLRLTYKSFFGYL